MIRLTISMSEGEFEALASLAKGEYRTVRDEAALILRRYLEYQGMVEPLSAHRSGAAQNDRPNEQDEIHGDVPF